LPLVCFATALLTFQLYVVLAAAGFDVFRRCRMTLPCHKTRESLVKATSSLGKVKPKSISNNVGNDSSSSSYAQQWPPSAATAKQLAQTQSLQQQLVVANSPSHVPSDAPASAAATAAVAPSRRRARASAAVAAGTGSVQTRPAAAAAAAAEQQQSSSSRFVSSRRRRSRSASVTAGAAAAAAAQPAVTSDFSSSSSSSSSSSTDLQQQQQQVLLHPVEVPPVPLPVGCRTNQLVEMLLQRPQLIKEPQQLEEGYIWQQLIMVSIS
jgi:hypothetical protein